MFDGDELPRTVAAGVDERDNSPPADLPPELPQSSLSVGAFLVPRSPAREAEAREAAQQGQEDVRGLEQVDCAIVEQGCGGLEAQQGEDGKDDEFDHEAMPPTHKGTNKSLVTAMASARQLVLLPDLADYPVSKMRTYKFLILVVALAITLLSGTAECVRHTYAKKAIEAGESFDSLAALEARVWSHWAPTRLWVMYESKSLANSICGGAMVIWISRFGLGISGRGGHSTFVAVVCIGGTFMWGFQLAARSFDSEENEVAVKVLKILSYVVATFYWFAALPLICWRETWRLKFGTMFPLAVLDIFLSAVALISNRVYGVLYPQIALFATKVLELILALSDFTFHDLGHLLALTSFFAAYPVGLIWVWRMLGDMPLGSTAQTMIITTFTFVGKTHMDVMARGAVTYHQRSIVMFPVQLLEHFWTKCLIASTPMLSLDFFGASLVETASLYLQCTHHGRQATRRLLAPFLERSDGLRLVLAETLHLDQPAWKVLLLIEHEVFIATHNIFADISAICMSAVLITWQWILVTYLGFEATFAVAEVSAVRTKFGWLYLVLLHVIVAWAASCSTVKYVTKVQGQFQESRAEDPRSPEVDPITYLAELANSHVSVLRRNESFGPNLAQSPRTAMQRSNMARAELDVPVYQRFKDSTIGAILRRIESEGGHLEKYISLSVHKHFHSRFSAFRQLTPQSPALLMDPRTLPATFHNTLMARFIGFFVVTTIFITSQTLYMLAPTAELVTK
mmetsp:Transcript_59385/g.133832  ORF Transcript_59385/g.133832 Transcript_59385/m.133832 type:complete len:740 (-) Transcript_59385:162-2381(-)